MANLKEIRIRISSVGSTMQITNAMKMVSVAKLKRAQDAITAMLPYANKINELIQNISGSLEGNQQSPYSRTNEQGEHILLVAITSNKGLCGGFNSNVIKRVNSGIESLKGKNVTLATIGKKGNDILRKNHKVDLHNSEIFDDLTFENSEKISGEIMNEFIEGKYDKVYLVYNHFVNAATQEIMYEQFLPILPPQENDNATNSDYIFEPSKVEIVESLIPKSLKIQFFKALRDSVASEHGSRMTAMHKATDNAKALKDDLTLTYNKARQAAITNEILEIVGGAEALNA